MTMLSEFALSEHIHYIYHKLVRRIPKACLWHIFPAGTWRLNNVIRCIDVNTTFLNTKGQLGSDMWPTFQIQSLLWGISSVLWSWCGPYQTKKCLWTWQYTQIQIILRMRKVSSGPLLSIHTFCSRHWFCKRTVKILIDCVECTGWSGPALSACALKTGFRIARPI